MCFWSDDISFGQGRWQGPARVTDVAVAKDAVRLQHANQWVNRHTSQMRLVLPRLPSSAAPLPSAAAPTASSPTAGPSAPTPVSAPTSGSHAAASSDDQTDDEAVASMMSGAAAALHLVAAADAAAPPPPPPTPASRWAGRTRSTSHRAFVVARAARRAARPGRSRDAMRAALSTPDDLGGALHGDGAVAHQALVTRRELRRRAEVPAGLAGAAFDDAMTAELDAWSDLAVYTEVAYAGQVVLSTRLVLTIKDADSPGGAPRRKARLVVRGFEDPDRDSVDSTSPTPSPAGMRVALAAMATHSFIARTVDVRTAFLQGLPLDRPTAVYIQPPPQACVPLGSVWQLRKCAYGLTDAPRRWYDGVLLLLTALQLKRAPLDHGVFTQHRRGALVFVVAVHVEDFLFGCTTAAVQRFSSALRGAFAAGPTRSGALTFTGVRVRTVADDVTGGLSIAADQEPYVDSIESIVLSPQRAATPDARLTAAELTLYRRATGALLWATGQTMPYLACAASTLGRRFTRAAVHHFTTANRVIKAAKAARPLPFVFRALRGDIRLRLFVDAFSVKLGVPTAHTSLCLPRRQPAPLASSAQTHS